ncbi:MAG: hypothetical protein ACOZCO_01290 [Bacteroidota bacterium]
MLQNKLHKYPGSGIVILLFLAGMYLVPLRITGFGMDYIPGDKGDSRFNNYVLEHGHRFLAGKEDSFWTAPFMFPQEKNIALSDNLLGTLPVYSFFRMLGTDKETAFQWWFVTMFVFNFFAAWFSLYKITGNKTGAALGAFVFAFSMPVIAQINHVQLLPRFAIPLCFYFLIYFLRTLHPLHFAGFVLMLTWQFYCGMYLGFLLLLAIVFFLFIAAFLLIPWKKLFRQDYRFWLKITGLTVFALLVIYPLAGPYLETVSQIGYRDFEKEIVPGLPRVLSHFYSVNDSILWNSLSTTGDYLPYPWEHRIFAGAISWLCLAVITIMAFKARKTENGKLMIVFVLTLFLLGLISLFAFGDTLYKLVLYFPGFGSMRILTRIIFVMLFFFSAAIAFSFLLLEEKFHLQRNVVLGASVIAALLVVADQYVSEKSYMRFSKAEAQQQIAFTQSKIALAIQPRHKIVALMPRETADVNHLQLDAMLACQEMDLKCVNGYASSAPGSFGLFWWKPCNEHLDIWLKEKGFTDTTAVLRLY